MSSNQDIKQLLAALKWYESLARQALVTAMSFNHTALAEVVTLLAKDAGQRGLKARALYSDDSEAAGVGA